MAVLPLGPDDLLLLAILVKSVIPQIASTIEASILQTDNIQVRTVRIAQGVPPPLVRRFGRGQVRYLHTQAQVMPCWAIFQWKTSCNNTRSRENNHLSDWHWTVSFAGFVHHTGRYRSCQIVKCI